MKRVCITLRADRPGDMHFAIKDPPAAQTFCMNGEGSVRLLRVGANDMRHSHLPLTVGSYRVVVIITVLRRDV
jgi:hypothetical protein